MAVRLLLGRLAATAPAPVVAAIGDGGAAAVARLAPDPRLTLETSPRHATVLLVAGIIRPADRPALRRLHDQMPHPRATVWWGCPPLFSGPPAATVDADDDPAATIAATHRAVMTGVRPSEPDQQPDEPPHPWRGCGDYGQGGEGMMGGTPYGRPMPMTDDDLRDGLALDAYTATFGPFLPVFPPGLALTLTLQGDVIQQAEVQALPYVDGPDGAATARHRVARLVHLLGLPARAERILRAATAEGLERRLRRLGVFAAIPPGLGRVSGQDVRDRLRTACAVAGGAAPARAMPEAALPDLLPEAALPDLLAGLEWHEAVLVLNSFPAEDLGRLCATEDAA